MFASRLLNILQTVPNDVEYETCVFDLAEQDTTMKENEKATAALDSKDPTPQVFEVKGDENWIPKFADNLSIDDENRTRDSSRKEDQNGLSYHLDLGHESSVQEITHFNGNEIRDSSSSSDVAASDSLATDESLYTNNNAMECELPELMVCYKEVNYHMVKDIRVDEGTVEDKIVIESSRENANQHGSKEENDGNLEKSLDKDNAKHCDPADSVQIPDTNFGATGKSITGSPDNGSLVEEKLPIQEFGTRSFLRSFINSLDDQGNKVAQLSHQISPGKAVSEAPVVHSVEPGSKEDVQIRSLLYNSEVESGSITFNFNSPGNVKEQPVCSSDVHVNHKGNVKNDHEEPLTIKNESSNDSSANSQVQSGSSNDNVQEQSKRSSASNDEQASSEANFSKLYDEGETSFSAAGRSEPIAFSGSLSHRSDGSTTSARSFAFPVLQNEWNSSPVRMAKADRRHFRKHKCWRSGLFCCRF